MSEQSEREAYNEAAREYHEGREREAMDRPMFTQRDMDAAVQGEREACAMAAEALRDEARRYGAEGSAVCLDLLAARIRSRGPAPAVDVKGKS